jgi:hypothetical protein
MDYSIRVDGILHHLRINCSASGTPAAGTPMASVLLNNVGGTTQTAAISLNGFWNFIKPLFHTGVSCEDVTLWKYVTGTTIKNFIAADVPTTPAGTSATAYSPAQQFTMTFRTAAGGIAKNVLLETSTGGNAVANLTANAAGNNQQKVAAYWLSTAGWMIGRDDTFPVSPLRYANTQNESIYRKRFRRDL